MEVEETERNEGQWLLKGEKKRERVVLLLEREVCEGRQGGLST